MNKKEWIDAALAAGFESFEIYEAMSGGTVMKWYEGDMESFESHRVTGTSLRGVYLGKMVSLATEAPEALDMAAALAEMKEQAQVITSEDVEELRSPEKTEEAATNRKWVKPDPADVKKVLADLERSIKAADPRLAQIEVLEWAEETSARQITNSKGMDVGGSGQMQLLVAAAVAAEGDDVKTAFKIEPVEDLSTVDVQDFAARIAEDAVLQLGATSLPSGPYKVILERHAMSSILSALSGIFSGDLIGKGLSPLREKLGETIFSEKITLVDDPRDPDALNFANYDDEGCPTQRKLVVDKGVFTTALHNTKSAARMNTVSTGNGFKAGYASPVNVSPMNMQILPGDKPLEELCEAMGEGVVITELQGLHAGLDPVTTDFSLQSSGYLVRNGKRDKSVSLITVAGNFLELMKTVVAVGSDVKWEGHITAPSILFESIAVSGDEA